VVPLYQRRAVHVYQNLQRLCKYHGSLLVNMRSLFYLTTVGQYYISVPLSCQCSLLCWLPTCVPEQQQEVSAIDSSQDPVQDKMTHNFFGSGQTLCKMWKWLSWLWFHCCKYWHEFEICLLTNKCSRPGLLNLFCVVRAPWNYIHRMENEHECQKCAWFYQCIFNTSCPIKDTDDNNRKNL